MRFLKKPVVAVLLSALIVIASTLVSVKIQFGAKVREVNDLFMDGMVVNGETQPGVAASLREIHQYAQELIPIAQRSGLDVEDVENASEWLRLSLQYSTEDASYVHYEYTELSKALDDLRLRLDEADLSAGDRASVDTLYEQIADATAQVRASDYNDAVRAFYKKYAHFPTDTLATLAGVYMPMYFQ